MDKQKKRRPSDSASKNVSHVPCKFYRQGVCQAGDNCPFSHELDTSTKEVVCKYFQKGNCKFGSKCALAHITPDGRRVSKKKREKSDSSKEPAPPQAQTPVPNQMVSPVIYPASAPIAGSVGGSSIGSIGSPLGSPLNFPISSRPATAGSSRTSSFHFDRAIFPSRSSSASRTTALWIDRPKNPMAFEGSAVTDDDDDDSFEEDLVPSALSDLLTPQERERRNSRHSQPRPEVPLSAPSTELWSTPRFHRGSFGRDQTPQKPLAKVDPIGTPDLRS